CIRHQRWKLRDDVDDSARHLELNSSRSPDIMLLRWRTLRGATSSSFNFNEDCHDKWLGASAFRPFTFTIADVLRETRQRLCGDARNLSGAEGAEFFGN